MIVPKGHERDLYFAIKSRHDVVLCIKPDDLQPGTIRPSARGYQLFRKMQRWEKTLPQPVATYWYPVAKEVLECLAAFDFGCVIRPKQKLDDSGDGPTTLLSKAAW